MVSHSHDVYMCDEISKVYSYNYYKIIIREIERAFEFNQSLRAKGSCSLSQKAEMMPEVLAVSHK